MHGPSAQNILHRPKWSAQRLAHKASPDLQELLFHCAEHVPSYMFGCMCYTLVGFPTGRSETGTKKSNNPVHFLLFFFWCHLLLPKNDFFSPSSDLSSPYKQAANFSSSSCPNLSRRPRKAGQQKRGESGNGTTNSSSRRRRRRRRRREREEDELSKKVLSVSWTHLPSFLPSLLVLFPAERERRRKTLEVTEKRGTKKKKKIFLLFFSLLTLSH